jgi:hypothetical protein
LTDEKSRPDASRLSTSNRRFPGYTPERVMTPSKKLLICILGSDITVTGLAVVCVCCAQAQVSNSVSEISAIKIFFKLAFMKNPPVLAALKM